MESIVSIKPVLALAVSAVAALCIIYARHHPNLRETFSLGAGVLKLLIVVSMAPVVLAGGDVIRHDGYKFTVAETRPLAGTRQRGKTTDDDSRLTEELLTDPKERAEHIMLVDLERNDLGRVCRYGSVQTSEFMAIEQCSHVNHIVSTVQGHLAESRDAFDLIQAMFPGGTITGAPKIRCMEILDELEPTTRGPYTGSLGYLSLSGDLDLNILIRSVIVKGTRGYIQVGAGIVADSVPEREYEETLLKAEALFAAMRN